jgi:hypothetical protein
LVTFSTKDTPDELDKNLKIRKPRWKNFDLEDNIVISDEEYDKDEQKSYICDVCQTTLQYNDIDKSYWCNTCVLYIQTKDVKKTVDFEVPQSVQNVEPAVYSIDYTLGDTDRVKIDHRPQPKGSFAELQRKGLRITDYREETPT